MKVKRTKIFFFKENKALFEEEYKKKIKEGWQPDGSTRHERGYIVQDFIWNVYQEKLNKARIGYDWIKQRLNHLQNKWMETGLDEYKAKAEAMAEAVKQFRSIFEDNIREG